MSVQSSYPSQLPDRVRTTILGQSVVADVVDTVPDADAGRGPWDVLVVEYGGSRYRVDADEADAIPPT
jgi:hypothetical protein